MPTDTPTEPRWSDLATRGAIVVRGFLDADEIELLRQDFASQAVTPNKNLQLKEVTRGPVQERIEPKLVAAAAQIRAAAGIEVDRVTGGTYFAIELGVNEAWHQDHESFFLFQEHYHYLNFWIPIEKPDPQRSNLGFVPMDELLARAPHARDAVIGGGASRCVVANGQSDIYGDDRGGKVHLDFDVNDIGVIPEVSPGDLVLLRGDVFHRTQDASTRRMAVSFRMINSNSVVRKRKLLQGGRLKHRMLLRNPWTYAKALQYFNKYGRHEVFVGELLDYMIKGRMRRRATLVALAELVLRWRRPDVRSA